MSGLSTFNDAEAEALRHAFLRTCGSGRWVDAMIAAVPFEDTDALFAAAESSFNKLNTGDWLQAFADHPRLGDLKRLRKRFAHSGDLSEQEQAGLAGADETVLQALQQANRDYEERFGHVFLICAAGKGAPEILEALKARIDNDATSELRIAGAEQRKITRIRLELALA